MAKQKNTGRAVSIAVATQKGGIGKTTTALALADVLIGKKKKVLLIDTDPQCNSTYVYKAQTDGVATLADVFFGNAGAKECIQTTEYGDIIAGDEQLWGTDTMIKPSPKMYKYIKNAIKEVEGEYDYIIYDTPRGTGTILGNVLIAAQHLIIPVTCDSFGIQGLSSFHTVVTDYLDENPDLRITGILKIKYKGKQKLTADIEENLLPKIAKNIGSKVFKTTIRESVKCQEAQTLRLRLSDYAPTSTTAVDYVEFTKELLKEVSRG